MRNIYNVRNGSIKKKDPFSQLMRLYAFARVDISARGHRHWMVETWVETSSTNAWEDIKSKNSKCCGCMEKWEWRKISPYLGKNDSKAFPFLSIRASIEEAMSLTMANFSDRSSVPVTGICTVVCTHNHACANSCMRSSVCISKWTPILVGCDYLTVVYTSDKGMVDL